MGDQSLKQKTVKGMSWSAVDQVSRMGISFIVGIILARLLSPEEYGLIGILTIFITIFGFICDSGFSNALIRKKDIEDIDYSTVFYVNFVLSFFLAILFFFSAPLIAAFFERPQLVSLTKAMSSIVLINAFTIVQRVRLSKAVDFRTHAIVNCSSSLLSGVIGIAMAYMGYGVWALVAQQISAQTIAAILLWLMNRWMPKLEFSVSSFREMWGFGWKMLVSGLLDTTWKQIYEVVIGKCYSPATLGLYTRANQFCKMFSQNLNNVVQGVTFPVLSEMQDDRERLKSGYQRVIRCTMLPTFVLMLGLAATARPMILTLLGDKWIECVPFIQLICFSSMLYPLNALNLNMLQVQGRSDLFLKLEIIKKIIAVGPIMVGIFINIYWMIAGSVFTGFISYYLNAYYSGPFLNYSIKDQIRDIMPSFIISLVMAAIVYPLSFIHMPQAAIFAIQILLAASVVIGLCEKMKLSEYCEIKAIVLPIIFKVLKRQ